jgi:hypothetical protein
MPVDASIYAGIKPAQPRNLLADYGNVMQIQGMQQQGEMNRLLMDEKRRGIADQDSLRNSLSEQGADPYNVLLKHGRIKEASEFNKGKFDNERVQLETNIKKAGFAAQILSTARDQQTYDAARATAQANGLDVTRMPPQFNPQFVAAKLQESQTIAEQLAQQWKQKGFDLDLRKQGESERHNRTTEGINGGQLRVAQGNLNLRGQELQHSQGQGKAPSGYRFKPDGSLEAIPGGPAIKSENASEGERKAATLLQRLEGSQKQLLAALNTNPNAAKPELLSSGLRNIGAEAAANTITNTQRQQVENAQLDILDAALTLGTGAAYTREQLEGYRRSYFPQIGDDEATVKDKADRLNNVIGAAKTSAGRAAKPADPAPKGLTPAKPGGQVLRFDANGNPVQ